MARYGMILCRNPSYKVQDASGMPPGLQNPPKNPKIQGFREIPENPGIPLYSLQLRGGHYVAYYTSPRAPWTVSTVRKEEHYQQWPKARGLCQMHQIPITSASGYKTFRSVIGHFQTGEQGKYRGIPGFSGISRNSWIFEFLGGFGVRDASQRHPRCYGIDSGKVSCQTEPYGPDLDQIP